MLKKQLLKFRSYKDGSPERAISGFINSWANEDWHEMSKYCHLTWRLETPLEQQAIELEQRFSSFKLRTSKINRVFMNEGLNTRVIIDVKLSVLYQMYGLEDKLIDGMFSAIFKFRLLKETGLREPSVEGEWGVNVFSFVKD
jgi:hypothetical protein